MFASEVISHVQSLTLTKYLYSTIFPFLAYSDPACLRLLSSWTAEHMHIWDLIKEKKRWNRALKNGTNCNVILIKNRQFIVVLIMHLFVKENIFLIIYSLLREPAWPLDSFRQNRIFVAHCANGDVMAGHTSHHQRLMMFHCCDNKPNSNDVKFSKDYGPNHL